MDINQMSETEKIGQMLFPAAYIHDDEAGIDEVTQWIKKHHVGGLVFFHSRVSAATSFEANQEIQFYNNTLEKLKELISYYQSISKYPLLMCIDAEYGLAMRIENSNSYPFAITLGCLPESSDHLIFDIGKQIARDLKEVGLHMNFAPVADINTNLANPVIGYRSFGQNKVSVATKCVHFYKGMHSENVLGSIKHFPGHGDTNKDSHLDIPTISKTRLQLENEELYPFKYALSQGVDSLMVGHLSVPALSGDDNLPATLSPKIIKQMLREEWKYEGLIITDALNMRAVSNLFLKKGELEKKAFLAGNDILLVPFNISEAIREIEATALKEQWQSSVMRIIRAKEFAGVLHSQQKYDNITENALGTSNIFEKVAKKSIVNYYESNDFSQQDSVHLVLTISENQREHFSSHVVSTNSCKEIELLPNDISSDFKLNEILKGVDTLIVALFVPQLKTKNLFGISEEILALIDEIALKVGCRLYLFGNPLAVQLFKDKKRFQQIVLVPQKELEFQKEAFAYCSEKVDAGGINPFNS